SLETRSTSYTHDPDSWSRYVRMLFRPPRLSVHTRRNLWLLGVVLSVWLGWTAQASAQSFDELEKDDQVAFDRLLDKCITAYDRGRFEEAEALCNEAAAITPHPATQHVIARIRDRDGQCDDAVALYKGVRDTPAPGASEARWLEEYTPKLDEYID